MSESSSFDKSKIASLLIGKEAKALHPITCLNPSLTFSIFDAKIVDNRILVRGEETCWWGQDSWELVPSATQDNHFVGANKMVRNAVIEEVRAIVRGEKAMWEFIKRKGGGDDSGITACENIEDGLIALKTTSEQTNEAPQGTGESDRVKESAIPAGAAPFIERRKGERRIRIPTPDDKLYGGRLGTDRRKAK